MVTGVRGSLRRWIVNRLMMSGLIRCLTKSGCSPTTIGCRCPTMSGCSPMMSGRYCPKMCPMMMMTCVRWWSGFLLPTIGGRCCCCRLRQIRRGWRQRDCMAVG